MAKAAQAQRAALSGSLDGYSQSRSQI